MIAREWSVLLRVSGVWVGETDVESHEGWDCFTMRKINKQTQTK